MSTLYWLGTASTTQQISACTVTALDATPANNIFTITIGNVAVSVAGITNVATTATALATAAAASTHPYFTMSTWTANTATVTAQQKSSNAGVPFTAVSSVTGIGSGTIGAFSTSTASAGQCNWSTASNWSGGAVPITGDTVIIRDSSVNILYGLDQSAVTLDKLVIEKSYSGYIGLNRTQFAQTSTGSTNSNATEYKPTYLKIGATICNVGEYYGAGTAQGSARMLLDLHTAATTLTIFGSATSPAEQGRQVIRLKLNNVASAIDVRSCPGGLAIAGDTPGETSTLGDLTISDTSSTSKVVLGEGVSVANIATQGGVLTIRSAGTIGDLSIFNGTVISEGDWKFTQVTIYSGYFQPNNAATADAQTCATTLDQYGGVIDALGSRVYRVVPTLNNWGAGEMRADRNVFQCDPIMPYQPSRIRIEKL